MNTETKLKAVGDIVFYYYESEGKILKCRIDTIEEFDENMTLQLFELSRKVDDQWVPFHDENIVRFLDVYVFDSKNECKKGVMDKVVENMRHKDVLIKRAKDSIKYQEERIATEQSNKDRLQKILDNICRL